jgi:hypothetical protein
MIGMTRVAEGRGRLQHAWWQHLRGGGIAVRAATNRRRRGARNERLLRFVEIVIVVRTLEFRRWFIRAGRHRRRALFKRQWRLRHLWVGGASALLCRVGAAADVHKLRAAVHVVAGTCNIVCRTRQQHKS